MGTVSMLGSGEGEYLFLLTRSSTSGELGGRVEVESFVLHLLTSCIYVEW